MTEQTSINIIDKYISEWALPNESIASWIKWDGATSLDKLVLKYEADVFIPRFLNIDDKIFDQDIRSGEINIPLDYIQIPGFFGFHAAYTAIPDSERELEFVLEFIANSESVHIERFHTKIVRPLLKCVTDPSDILIEGDSPSLQAISIAVTNHGSVHPAEATITFSVNTTSDLRIAFNYEKVADNTKENVAEEVQINNMTIKGKGRALLKLSLEYTDNMKNKYHSPIATITLDVRQKVQDEIRFNGLRASDALPLLLAA